MDGDTIGNTNKQGGRTLRVGQIVEHVSKQYRAVVLGHTMVCAAPQKWVEKHNILQLPNGRKQIFYHLLPDTRDIDLSIPPSFAATTSSSFSSSSSLSIADCTPAFLCGSDQNDNHPFLMTGYAASDELRVVDATLIDTSRRAISCSFASRALYALSNVFRSPQPLQHPSLSRYFQNFKTEASEGGGFFPPQKCVDEVTYFHMPEWLSD